MDLPVVIVADDLIWSTRLAGLVTAAGRRSLVVGSLPALTAALPGSSAVIVDLTSRRYDGIAAVDVAARGARPVLAVGQHDDAELRKRALAAGADRVYAYRLLFERGAAALATWLERQAPVTPGGGPE